MPFLSSEQRAAVAIGVPVVALLLYLWYRRRQNSQFSDEEEDFTQVEESEEVASANQRTIEVRVPHAVVGAIIGKSGVNIKKIEKDTGVRVNLKDENEGSESEERIVLIQGEREKAKRAEILVKKIIAEQPVIRTEEIFIPQRACGRIIGKGGQTIRQLCSISGAKIRIDRDQEDMSSPLRKCTVTGTYDQIASAKGLLDEKIAEDNEIRARRGDIGMPRNRHAPRKLDTALASSITGVLQFPKTNEFFAVFVSAIDNPGHFWVQLLTKDSPDLDKLTNDLTFLYSSSESHSVLNAFKVGDICCAPFEYDSSWYRARILEINKDGMVDLYYVDFGDSGKIHKEKLRELKQEHSRIPFQAIECYLADVRPKDGEWSKEATDEFDQLTHCAQWVSVMARVLKYDGDIPCVELIDTTGQTDVNINEEMIRAQFAYRDVSCTADERELVSELVQDALQATPVEIKQSSTEQQELTPPGADTAGEINGETTQHVMETIQGQKSSDALSKPSSTDVQDGPPSGDVTDSCPELHGPVVAESDSPVKAALLKSISRDYIAAHTNSSPDVLDEGRASLSIVQEQGVKAGSGSGVHGVQSQHEASNSPGKNAEELHSTTQEKAAYRSSLNIAASSRRTMAATFSGSRHGSERSESPGKPVTSTVHRQMVSSKQSYISTVTLPERDTNNVVVSVLPSVTQLQAKSPFDLESHAFKASSGSTTLTRHAVTSEVHRTVTQSNGRDTTNEFSSSRVEEKLASRMSPSDEKPTVKYEINFESIKGIPVAEHYTIKKTFSQLESGPHAGFEALDSASSVAGAKNTVSTASASSSGKNNGSEQSGNFISRGSSEESGGDMSPSGSLLDIAKNDVIDEEEEDDDEQADQDDATADSPEQDSDEESFISAREDVTSDTDTAAYMTAPPGGSSTSLDTDVALGDSAADETITPVNSDTEVEHEEEAEDAGLRGDATPRPAAEAGKDRSRSDTLKGLKDQMTALGGAITSDGDLGYSGDSEEGLESAEDLRTAST